LDFPPDCSPPYPQTPPKVSKRHETATELFTPGKNQKEFLSIPSNFWLAVPIIISYQKEKEKENKAAEFSSVHLFEKSDTNCSTGDNERKTC
jgi:hypothetical protein